MYKRQGLSDSRLEKLKTAVGERLGIANPVVVTKSTCVDSKRQWRHASNIWHNSMIRSVLQTITAPVVGLAHKVRRDKGPAQT